MKNHFSIIFCIIMLFNFETVSAKKVYATREYKESVDVAKRNTLKVQTNMSNVKLEEWNNDRIEIQTTVKGWGKNIDAANERVENIVVNLQKEGLQIHANVYNKPVQKIPSPSGIQIETIIYIPVGIPVDVTCINGDFIAGVIRGDFSAKVDHGKFSAEKIEGTNNRIELRYGDFLCGNISSLVLTTVFGKIKSENVNNVIIKSEYCDFSFKDIKTLSLESKFDKFKIENIDQMQAEMAHSTFDIAKLGKVLVIKDLKFGGLRINELNSDFELVDIYSEHSDVTIYLAPGYSFQFDLKNEKGKIITDKFGDDTSSYYRSQEVYTHEFRGIAGDQKKPTSKMKIFNKFKNITIKNK